MRHVTGLILVGLIIGPALAETAKDSTAPNEKTSPDAVTYEDCVARCEKCKSRRNPDCVKNFCTGYPHRQPGAGPLPVVCPQMDERR
jgi:hypothetical protein